MPSRTLKRASRRLLQYVRTQMLTPIRFPSDRRSASCGCESEGKCTCGPDCPCGPECPCRKKPCPLGPKPADPREQLSNSASESIEIPSFMDSNIFRAIQENEQVGPGATKSGEYKNPEYYSYHRYSYIDLKLATNAAKKAFEKPPE